MQCVVDTAKCNITPMMIAAHNCLNEELENMIRDNPRGINERDNWGRSPIVYALEAKNFDGVRILMKTNQVKDFQDKWGWSLLMFALKHKEDRIFDHVLMYNPDVNVTNNFGDNPLMIAVCIGYSYAVEKLVTRVNDINTVNVHGYTAAYMSLVSKNYDCFRIIAQKGADLYVNHNLPDMISEKIPELLPFLVSIKARTIKALPQPLQNHYENIVNTLEALGSHFNLDPYSDSFVEDIKNLKALE